MASPFAEPQSLEKRTATYGEAVIEFIQALPRAIWLLPLTNQLLRTGTSLGAYYLSAADAAQAEERLAQLRLCRKEAKEAAHWLRMIVKAHPPAKAPAKILWQEAQELVFVLSAAINKTQ